MRFGHRLAQWTFILGSAAILAAGSASATSFGTNIVVNGDAEAGAGSATGGSIAIPGWTVNGNFTAVQYGIGGGFPETSISTAIGGGKNFFSGGENNSGSSASQVIDISDIAVLVDAGQVSAALSAFLGGFATQDDNMTIAVKFLDGTQLEIGSFSIGPVTEPDRGGITDLLERSATHVVAAGTRALEIDMVSTRLQGSYDDGYADNVSLKLTSRQVQTDVPEPGTIALMVAGLAGLGLARRRRA